MRHRWPEDTRFTRLVLEVEDKVCAVCGGVLHICDHRRHRIFTLQGPVEVVCKLAHCSDLQCAARAKYLNINFSILMWPESLLYNLCRNGSGCLQLLGLNMKKTYMQKMVTSDIL